MQRILSLIVIVSLLGASVLSGAAGSIAIGGKELVQTEPECEMRCSCCGDSSAQGDEKSAEKASEDSSCPCCPEGCPCQPTACVTSMGCVAVISAAPGIVGDLSLDWAPAAVAQVIEDSGYLNKDIDPPRA